MLFILYGATGPIRNYCIKCFSDNGFTQVDKINYLENPTDLVARYGSRKFVDKAQFEAETDFRYNIDGMVAGFQNQQIIDAARGLCDKILSVSTGDLTFIYEIKKHYGDYVTVIFLYIENDTLEKTIRGYDNISLAEINKRLDIGKLIKQNYSDNIDLFDYTVIYDGEDGIMNYKQLLNQFLCIIQSRRIVEKDLNGRRYVALPYSGPDPYIFVSYSHKDSTKVLGIMWQLQRNGYRIWFDDGIRGGTNWRRIIERKISDADIILLFCSENSVASNNVEAEINGALNMDKKILTVRLDNTRFTGYEMYLSISNNIQYNDKRLITKLCEALGNASKI